MAALLASSAAAEVVAVAPLTLPRGRPVSFAGPFATEVRPRWTVREVPPLGLESDALVAERVASTVGARAIVWARATEDGDRVRIEIDLVRQPRRSWVASFETPRADGAAVVRAVALRAVYLLERSDAPATVEQATMPERRTRRRVELTAGPAAAVGLDHRYVAPGLGLHGSVSVVRKVDAAARVAWMSSVERGNLDVGLTAGAIGPRLDLELGRAAISPWLGWSVAHLAVQSTDDRSAQTLQGLAWGADASLGLWRAWGISISAWDLYLPNSRLYQVHGVDSYRFPNHALGLGLEIGLRLR
jgi:hypothetical protein